MMRETDVSTHFTDHKTEALTSVRAILGHKPGYEQREAETGILTPSLWFFFFRPSQWGPAPSPALSRTRAVFSGGLAFVGGTSGFGLILGMAVVYSVGK